MSLKDLSCNMARKQTAPKKKYFTPEQANAMLPLVSRIVRDIVELAHDLRERHQRLERLMKHPAGVSAFHPICAGGGRLHTDRKSS